MKWLSFYFLVVDDIGLLVPIFFLALWFPSV